ncbi:MAG: stage II sporulation protein M [Acidimicrobiales bacterium]
MDIDAFVATHSGSWDRLGELAGRASRSLGRLDAAELDELVRLYQRCSTHLSQARTTYRDPALVARLSGAVASAGTVVYGTRPRAPRRLGRFFATTFPAAVWASRRFVAVSALLLVVPATAAGVWLVTSDRAVEAAAPAAVREAYVEEDFEDYYSSDAAAVFAAEVFTNNVRVAIMAFAVGILLCVLTAAILAVNGASLGVAAGLFAAAGEPGRFWGLILPHGLLELTAVVIAGAAGLGLGWAVVVPGDRSRADALAEEGRRSVVVALGLVAAFAVAGVIEGFVTGRPWPTAVRVGIGVAAWAGFAAYLVARGRGAAARGLTGVLGEEEAGAGWTSRGMVGVGRG